MKGHLDGKGGPILLVRGSICCQSAPRSRTRPRPTRNTSESCIRPSSASRKSVTWLTHLKRRLTATSESVHHWHFDQVNLYAKQLLHALGSGPSDCSTRRGPSPPRFHPVPKLQDCMDALPGHAHRPAVRGLTHINRLDDQFGDSLVRVVCLCGAVRETQPQVLAHLIDWNIAKTSASCSCVRCSQTRRNSMRTARASGLSVSSSSGTSSWSFLTADPASSSFMAQASQVWLTSPCCAQHYR